MDPQPRPHHPYAAELEAERLGWYEIVGLVRSLTPDESLVAGYYRDPDWSVRDLIAHVGTWLAQADVEFAPIAAGTFRPSDDAGWWVQKTGNEHYAEHVARLREWVTELVDNRTI